MEFVTGPIEVVGVHAAGEVGDVIVGGIAPPPGDTVWEQSRWVHDDGRLRAMMLNEPRGGLFKHVNLLVPAVTPQADIGFIIMEPAATPPMSGSNSMCVATVVLETGIVEMYEPETVITLDAPGGPVRVVAECRDGKVTSVTVRNLDSFVARRDAAIDVDGRQLRVDIAYGGDSFVMVDERDLGVELHPGNGRFLADVGARIVQAANDQIGFEHPTSDWNRISFCQIAGPARRGDDGSWEMTNTVAIEPGKLDRSPTGTGVSARMALLRARGEMEVGDRLRMRSIIGSEFVGTIEADSTVGEYPAITPLITGTAWRYGRFRYEFDPTDPWHTGYRIGDTWPIRHQVEPLTTTDTAWYHGTRADLEPGDLIEAGFTSNYGDGRRSRYVYLTANLESAVWGAELAEAADGRSARVYMVEPTGPIEDDPNLTDKRFAGNPTCSYRTRLPLRVTGEVPDWQPHAADQIAAMTANIAAIAARGIHAID